MAREQMPLASIIRNQTFEGYLLVRAASQRSGQNGSRFLDMTLCDQSMEVNAKMWDGTVQAPAMGTIVKVRAVMLEYNSKPQLRIDKMRDIAEGDDVDIAALVPCAPEPPDKMYSLIYERARSIYDEELRNIILKRLDECKEKLEYAPAAMKLHHSERSGLLHHTSTMLKSAEAICSVYPTLNADLLCAGVILHDLGKISELNYDSMGIVSDYTVEGNLLGHLVQGAAELRRVGKEVGARDELIIMLEHMLISHHDLPEYGSPKPPMFPEAEVLHIIDLLDARMFEMNQALSTISPGCFTDKIWSLDRKLYKPKTVRPRPE